MKILHLFASCALSAIAVFTVASSGAPLQFLANADPLCIAAALCGSFILASFVLAWITGDYSQTDRLWSITPPLYVLYVAVLGWPDGRLALMASIALLWGARLTFNFARKGGYTTEEDYRWIFLRKKITNPAVWQVFNFFFIAGYQHLLVFLIALPAYAVYGNPGGPLGAADFAAAGLFLALLVFETIADQQMWNFQQEKKRKKAAGEHLDGDYKRGFITSGLFRYSRHPNYFAEVFIWWVFYLFVPAATGVWLHWSILGAVLLTILFQGSIWFTESISTGKYPEYAEYRRRVSWFVPWFPGRIKDEP
jgi:steroid 5-alpha reductase family enzyme